MVFLVLRGLFTRASAQCPHLLHEDGEIWKIYELHIYQVGRHIELSKSILQPTDRRRHFRRQFQNTFIFIYIYIFFFSVSTPHHLPPFLPGNESKNIRSKKGENVEANSRWSRPLSKRVSKTKRKWGKYFCIKDKQYTRWSTMVSQKKTKQKKDPLFL